jgi:hypothetical protein
VALVIWSLLSFILGLIGARIAFQYAFSPIFLKKNKPYLYLIYLSAYATLINTAIAQLGTLLLFFMMVGYHFAMTERDHAAGIMWGIIVAIKLFPALLFFHALAHKRYKICQTLLLTFVMLSLIPLFSYGTSIYSQYAALMPKVLWYGDSWNGSLYGLIFRLLMHLDHQPDLLISIQVLYVLLCCVSIIVYLKTIRARDNRASFCITLVMMLLLSPFGWVYYFPLLTFPLAMTFLSAIDEKNPSSLPLLTWCLCLFLINFPMNYIPTSAMPSLLQKLSLSSFYFYGLLGLLYCLTSRRAPVSITVTSIGY